MTLVVIQIVIHRYFFNLAQYPVRWTAQSALHFLPSLTDLFIPTPFSASPGSILAMQQLRATTKSLTFPPLSIARYSFIQLSQQGRQWREGKCPIFQTVAKGDSNPGSLDCESGILPLSYRAPFYPFTYDIAAKWCTKRVWIVYNSIITVRNTEIKQLFAGDGKWEKVMEGRNRQRGTCDALSHHCNKFTPFLTHL